MIEDHCRQLLVWWQKKLPLKNQPSNPVAQLLRQGLDEAPHFLAEARAKLLDPQERARIDAELHSEVIGVALDEFKKLLGFALADKELSKESETKLYAAGEKLGLTESYIEATIATELERIGAVRVVEPPPPPPPPLADREVFVSGAANGGGGGSPSDEFRRILKMSRLSLDGEEMTDDQRDAMCNLGESLGLTGGQAEDLIDEYLEEMASMPMVPVGKQAVPVPNRGVKPTPKPGAAGAAAAHKPAGAVKAPADSKLPSEAPRAIVPAQPVKKEPTFTVNLSAAARAAERQRFPNFTNSIGTEMLLVPTGRFVMGSDDSGAQPNESPLTPVVLSCFYIGRLPITNEQYEAFDPSHASKRAAWADRRHPVLYVSWNEAEAFCRWLSTRERKTYRLPTEAEWEYAARGDDGRIFPWGSWSSIGKFANFADARTTFPWRDPAIDDGFAETAPVGSYPRGSSPFGVEDMAGNVFEWCLDFYEPYKGKEIMNPRPSKSGRQRVYRGGSWKSRMSSLRATARAFNEPGYLANDVGFRIVCECA
jgi:formylglycine-generating enzyme required for sulfatase activity